MGATRRCGVTQLVSRPSASRYRPAAVSGRSASNKGDQTVHPVKVAALRRVGDRSIFAAVPTPQELLAGDAKEPLCFPIEELSTFLFIQKVDPVDLERLELERLEVRGVV
jgi:hypothetical protein